MGEHRENLTALLAKTLPAFPSAGRDGQAQIGWRVAWKSNILVLAAADMREVDGEKQYRRTDDGAWQRLPDGCEMYPLGDPLPPEKCDVVLAVVALWVDTMAARQGQQRAGLVPTGVELARIDLGAFLKIAEASLPSERRIVTPGMGISP
jgi:hypothetical protein